MCYQAIRKILMIFFACMSYSPQENHADEQHFSNCLEDAKHGGIMRFALRSVKYVTVTLLFNQEATQMSSEG